MAMGNTLENGRAMLNYLVGHTHTRTHIHSPFCLTSFFLMGSRASGSSDGTNVPSESLEDSAAAMDG